MANGVRRSLLVSGLTLGILLLWTAAARPVPEEAWILRWARTASIHPWRTGLAVFLIAWGLFPGRAADRSTELPGASIPLDTAPENTRPAKEAGETLVAGRRSS
jgi:hypothetical protein